MLDDVAEFLLTVALPILALLVVLGAAALVLAAEYRAVLWVLGR